MASGGTSNQQLRRRTSVSLLSNEQVRTSVVRELVQTERDFVKILRDVAEGYIAECRRRTDMFTEEQIETIFINLEELLDFQSEFLKDLETRIDWSAPYKSCVGECFLNHVRKFKLFLISFCLDNNCFNVLIYSLNSFREQDFACIQSIAIVILWLPPRYKNYISIIVTVSSLKPVG